MSWASKLFCIFAITFTMLVSAQEPTVNDEIQDKAVVVDQKRQDVKIAAISVEHSADGIVRDAQQDKAGAAANDVQDAQVAVNSAKIEELGSAALTDRQFMLMLVFIVIGVLIAIWILVYRSVAPLRIAAKLLIARTDMLEAHINETTPWVVEAYRANLEK